MSTTRVDRAVASAPSSGLAGQPHHGGSCVEFVNNARGSTRTHVNAPPNRLARPLLRQHDQRQILIAERFDDNPPLLPAEVEQVHLTLGDVAVGKRLVGDRPGRVLVEVGCWDTESSDEVLDLFVDLRGRRFPGKVYVLRLRYQPDWQQAGRRESFVDPENRDQAAPEFWPPAGSPLNPNYMHDGVLTPAICLGGVFGFHSVLHTERPMDSDDTSLLRFLVELQKMMDG